MSKSLFVLISDGGDGSYYPRFTLNVDLVVKLQAAYDANLMTYENGIGCDGDGFHYAAIQVPDDATYESLGITYPISDTYADKFKSDGEEVDE
jgi:hypothetical protein